MRIRIPALSNKTFKTAFYILLIIGLVLRFYQYFMGRSLWEDEAHLALNFIYFGYKDLMKPLANFQAAPIFFLFTVETFTRIFGYSELALRAFPFIVSTLVYPLYYFFALEITKNRLAAILSFTFVTFSVMLIEMASEVKPYTLDVSTYIGIGYLVVSQNKFVTKHRTLLLAVFGALAILYSNTAVMTLACTGFYIIYKWHIGKEGHGNKYALSFSKNDLYIFGAWAVVFLMNYFKFIYNHPYSEGMKGIWSNTFPPVDNSEELINFINARVNDTFFVDLMFISSEAFFSYVLLFIFIVAIGNIIYYRKTGLAIFTIVLIALHFTLSVFKIYPFYYRFILYLLPAFFLLIALGIAIIVQYLYKKSYKISAIVFLCLCCFFILKKPLKMYPKWDREIKPSFDFINNKYPHSKIYVTTPHTLLQFYLRTGYLKDSSYQPLPWNITPEQYFEVLGNQKSDYLLLHSSYGNGDGYGSILEELQKRNLVIEKFDYKSFGVWAIKPAEEQVLPDTSKQN